MKSTNKVVDETFQLLIAAELNGKTAEVKSQFLRLFSHMGSTYAENIFSFPQVSMEGGRGPNPGDAARTPRAHMSMFTH